MVKKYNQIISNVLGLIFFFSFFQVSRIFPQNCASVLDYCESLVNVLGLLVNTYYLLDLNRV